MHTSIGSRVILVLLLLIEGTRGEGREVIVTAVGRVLLLLLLGLLSLGLEDISQSRQQHCIGHRRASDAVVRSKRATSIGAGTRGGTCGGAELS